jgi:hypothetical protein
MLTLNDGRSELWQWDTGRKLTVDAECSQVHFSNKVFGRSTDMPVVDGVAEIPDFLLQADKDLTAWAFVGTPENGYTKISKVFKVNKRNKPADYVFTPPEQTTLEEIMERLDNLETIQDPDAIKNAVDDYLANNPIKVQETDPTVPEWAKKPNPPDVKIPDKLPNPHSITFTGAVDAIYDGSNPVEIKIPGSGGNANQGTGLTSTEKNLMLTLFKAVPYISDVSATMKTLEAIWSGGSSGGETPDIPDVTNYTVTYNLTSVTADSTPASVIEGGSLTVNLTPDTNAVLSEVIVTMGGVDVTADVYSNGKISIPSVTGDVVITATATVASYTQVEYLESASANAYMVTPCTLRPTDTIECVWSNMPSSAWVFPFGAYAAGVHCSLTTRPDNVAGRTSYTRRNGATYANRNTADASFVMPATSAMYRFTERTPGTGTIYDVDGNALVTLTDEQVSSYSGNGCHLGLFHIVGTAYNMHGVAERTGMRIHSFKITDVYGVATLDLIPVLDENNVPCMYDKVSGEYLYDASGANEFIAGGTV